ncbi:hypothetical protein G5B30_12570 [Sphingobacterium sp. SGG-5]|uniref:hypothetical protein n=1 Tax=Sphingobacterium sp. SGG-5 TaxID=2710881 RepID=UPI0013EA1839|nr:hypothetical protein [Sphingobacterium sp. SGG-5]NGM62747.1 hypothetical protein [Sphingobacterium sp. SGG-5]
MPIISRNLEIQEELTKMYDLLLSERNKIQKELAFFRKRYKNSCEKHINDNFNHEKEWLCADQGHYNKFIEYDIYCHLIEIVNDFKDPTDYFPEYWEMYRTLNQVMLRFAEKEKYEIAGIIKIWVDRIKCIITKCYAVGRSWEKCPHENSR